MEISEERWRPILNSLINSLENFSFSRERKMTRFYLEELSYRFWHYKLGPLCMCTDIDFVEYRPKVDSTGWVSWDDCSIVGLFEIKTPLSARLRPRNERQKNVLLNIAQQLNQPLREITFTQDLTMFEIERLDDPSFMTLTEKEFIQFMKKLGGI